MNPQTAQAPPTESASLKDLAWTFLKLGTIAFGGPAAHVAMMEDEMVTRRRWLTREEFLDLLGATNLIPGPNSTEMAIHIGYHRGGLKGLVVAGSCFIFPAFLMVLGFAWGYVRFGQLPAVGGILYGIKPVIIAVVFQALWRLGRVAIKTRLLAVAAAVAAVLNLAGVNELLVLLGGAVVVAGVEAALSRRRNRSGTEDGSGGEGASAAGLTLAGGLGLTHQKAAAAAAIAAAGTTGAATVIPVSLTPLFFLFLKIGSVLFGSGYVLLAFLQGELVERLGWMTQTELLNAVAVGQVTPGPLFTTATFIGYVLAGPQGAVVATVGIFLPAFFFVAVSAPFVARMRRSVFAGNLLDGVNVTSLALMGVVTWHLLQAAVPDVVTGLLALASAFLLFRFRLNSFWLVLGGAVAGLVAMWISGKL